MGLFWARGYYATSIDDLVGAAGVSRHGLYAKFHDKRGLFGTVMETYFETIVSPASGRVETEGAGFRNPLRSVCSGRRPEDSVDAGSLAHFLTNSAQGLWSVSRITPEPGPDAGRIDTGKTYVVYPWTGCGSYAGSP